MSTQVTLDLPDETYRRMEHLAHLTGRDLSDVLTDAIESASWPLGNTDSTIVSVRELADDALLALAESQMSDRQDRRLSELLDQRQSGGLTPVQQRELQALMQIYQDGLLRKAQALREAVQRGLRPPLTP